jgi:SRSO17 transposase
MDDFQTLQDCQSLTTEERLEAYLDGLGEVLRHQKKRANFAVYALGLMGSADRKSMEPIAVQHCPHPEKASAAHQQLLHFVSTSHWDDHEVRLFSARYAIEAMSRRSPVQTWIIDDTGFLKKGRHSVGVQRQYTGSAGKVANCQVGVSLVVANRESHMPVDFELYLPESWANDSKRRKEAKIPAETVFRTKPQIALDLIERARKDQLPGQVVLADSAYGDSSEFRAGIRMLGLDYAVGIHRSTKVYAFDEHGQIEGEATSAQQLATGLGESAFRRFTWREGTVGKLFARFAFVRVVAAHDDGSALASREPLWLIVEWPSNEAAPSKFSLATLPETMAKREMVRILKERYRTEKAYEEMKSGLGLDHFEGRRFGGWHHHISTVIACYAFVVAERVRSFPPEPVDQGRKAYDDEEEGSFESAA